MKTIGVIPARLGSTRLKQKVLARIAGKPMIQHVWERASQSQKCDEVLIACDDKRIMKAAKKFGARAVLTSRDHQSGSDRIAEVARSSDADIFVNIQGDEPLIDARTIDALVEALEQDTKTSMATVIKEFLPDEDEGDPNVVKVVVDDDGFAQSFSRGVPNTRRQIFKHIGIYAYRKDFLIQFSEMPKSANETRERLEQLRVLDAGFAIKTVLTDIEMIGVDTQADLLKVEERLKSYGKNSQNR